MSPTMIDEHLRLRRETERMSDDAYAGFLRLLLTPRNAVPRSSEELDAYLEYLNAQAPLPAEIRQMLDEPAACAA